MTSAAQKSARAKFMAMIAAKKAKGAKKVVKPVVKAKKLAKGKK